MCEKCLYLLLVATCLAHGGVTPFFCSQFSGLRDMMRALWLCTLLIIGSGSAQIIHQVTGSIQPNTSIECSGSGPKCYCHRQSRTPRKPYTLALTLTLSSQSIPAPIIIFFHGQGKYMLNTGDYLPYGKAAASSGYAFLEYDIIVDGSIVTVPDAVEVEFLPAVLQWASEINERAETPAKGRLDLDRLALAGHSRGGKLAALHFASDERRFFAAYLLDPVECPCFAPCTSDCYPSAVALFQNSNRPVGVSIAETIGCCNPHGGGDCGWTCQAACYAATGNGTCTGTDAQDFLDAAPAGSQGHTQDAGHLQFADDQDPIFSMLGNLFCGYNSHKSNKEVAESAAGRMIDWFDNQARLGMPESKKASR